MVEKIPLIKNLHVCETCVCVYRVYHSAFQVSRPFSTNW